MLEQPQPLTPTLRLRSVISTPPPLLLLTLLCSEIRAVGSLLRLLRQTRMLYPRSMSTLELVPELRGLTLVVSRIHSPLPRTPILLPTSPIWIFPTTLVLILLFVVT